MDMYKTGLNVLHPCCELAGCRSPPAQKPSKLHQHGSKPFERQSCQLGDRAVLTQLRGFQGWRWVAARQLRVRARQAQVCAHIHEGMS